MTWTIPSALLATFALTLTPAGLNAQDVHNVQIRKGFSLGQSSSTIYTIEPGREITVVKGRARSLPEATADPNQGFRPVSGTLDNLNCTSQPDLPIDDWLPASGQIPDQGVHVYRAHPRLPSGVREDAAEPDAAQPDLAQ